MLRNYLLLSRYTDELSLILEGATFLDAFSQEKDTLIIEVENSANHFFLEFCCSPGRQSIVVRRDFKRARKNVLHFFDHLLPSPIQGVSIAHQERIIRFKGIPATFYFYIHGNAGNVICTDGELTHTFRKENKHSQNSLASQNFSGIQSIPSLICTQPLTPVQLGKTFSFLGKEFIKEMHLRKNSEGCVTQNEIHEVLKIIQHSPLRICKDQETGFPIILPSRFLSAHEALIEDFDSVLETVTAYIRLLHLRERELKDRKRIDTYLKREFEYLSETIPAQQAVLDAGSKEDIFAQYGQLLLIGIEKFRKGDTNYVTENLFSDGVPVTIPIKETLSPRENVDHYFKKSRSEKINRQRISESLKKLNLRLIALEKLRERYQLAASHHEVKELMQELSIDDRSLSAAEQPGNRFRRYIIDDKFLLYVGKDSRNNDELTMEFARQNDYWFHARSVSGSHTVLRAPNPKDSIPKSVIKKAAAVAAFYSKAKTAGTVPVAYTLKKYVVKRKGMAVGMVSLLREEVVIVKPEIPEGVLEYNGGS